jgi:aryl-alcohol dehydrogenase-like predicted oxidoreductase
MLVSPIGLGTVKLGRNSGVKYPHPFDLPSDQAVLELLSAASNAGINLLDTAPAYGEAETRLGHLFAGSRDEWVLSTKAGEEFQENESRYDFSAAALIRSLERSLSRLRTDRVEVLLLHSDGLIELDPILDESRHALERLRDVGKTRAIGISTKTPAGGLRALEWADVVMLTLNPSATDDLPVIEAARQRGVGVLIKKALISGHVANPTQTSTPYPLHTRQPEPSPSAQECLRFSLTVPGVSSVIVGTANPSHLSQNSAAAAKALAPTDR